MGGLPEFSAAFGKLTTPKMEPETSWLSYLGNPIEKAATLHTTTGCYMT
jgi:hypothetical protein